MNADYCTKVSTAKDRAALSPRAFDDRPSDDQVTDLGDDVEARECIEAGSHDERRIAQAGMRAARPAAIRTNRMKGVTVRLDVPCVRTRIDHHLVIRRDLARHSATNIRPRGIPALGLVRRNGGDLDDNAWNALRSGLARISVRLDIDLLLRDTGTVAPDLQSRRQNQTAVSGVMRVLIVDHEPLARRGVRARLPWRCLTSRSLAKPIRG